VTLKRIMMLIVSAFGAYFLVRGILVAMSVPQPGLQIAALALWVVSLVLAVAAPGIEPNARAGGNRAPSRLPLAASALITALVVAAAGLALAAGGGQGSDPLVASVYGMVGETLVVVMVRRRPVCGWIGTALVAALGIAAMGPADAFGRGLLGTLLWVAVAQLILWSIDRAYLDTAELVRLQQASAAWQAAQEAGRSERRMRVRFALRVAGPSLTRAVATGGSLSEGERREALLAEAELRDELRAPHLLDDAVRTAVRAARERGAVVTVVDDGGRLDDGALGPLAAGDVERVRSRLAELLSGTDADRIIVRTSAAPDIAVSIVGRRSAARAASSGPGDDDDLVLWEEIPRRRVSP